VFALKDLIRLPRPRRRLPPSPRPLAHRPPCLRCGKPITRPQAAVRLGGGALAHPRCATYQRAG